VYVIHSRQRNEPIYAGGCLNLRRRFRDKFARQALAFWNTFGSRLAVRFFPAEPNPADLMGYQSLLVAKHRPRLNLANFLARA
jgi:hypothetical protein